VLARYVETCRNVTTCEIIVHLLVIVQNNKRCIKIKEYSIYLLQTRDGLLLYFTYISVTSEVADVSCVEKVCYIFRETHPVPEFTTKLGE